MAPLVEKTMVESGIILLKYWIEVRLPARKIGRYKSADYPFKYVDEHH